MSGSSLLQDVAIPRLTGTPGHAAVRERLQRELEARGLRVEVVPFEASAAPLQRTARAMELIGFAALFFISGAIAAHPGRGARLALLPLGLAVVIARSRFGNAPKALGANLVATPAYVIGNVVILGHPGRQALQKTIAAMRQCGKVVC